jgi:hypothetical protein
MPRNDNVIEFPAQRIRRPLALAAGELVVLPVRAARPAVHDGPAPSYRPAA